MNKNMVSIIITSYGEPDGLKRAVMSLICQSYQEIEIVVVDDNDPNTEYRKKTEQVIDGFDDKRIVYLKHEKNKNGAAARNTGIQAARGEYVCFLDNDDFYLSDRIQNAVTFFEHHVDYDGVCSKIMLVSNGTLREINEILAEKNFYDSMMNNIHLIGTGSNIFLRKRVLDEVKGFDECFQRFQDVEFMLRVAKKFRIGIIDSVDIVKVNSGLHSISFKKLSVATKLLIDKFRDEIESLPEEKKIRFYDERYTQLLLSAFNTGTEEDIEYARQLLQTVRPLSDREKSIENDLASYRKKRKNKEKMLKSSFFRYINSFLKRKNVQRIYRELPEKKVKELRDFLKIK